MSTWPNLSSQFNFNVDDSLQSWTHFGVQKAEVNSSEKNTPNLKSVYQKVNVSVKYCVTA